MVIASLLAGLIAFPAAAAEEDDIIYLTAINNSLQELKAETMPVKYKSLIYVPYIVFNSNELGTKTMYSKQAQVVVVSYGDVKLFFNMGAGTCYDSNGISYNYKAIYYNETAYLPAFYITKVFTDIKYSYRRVDEVGFHLVRLTRGETYTDDEFLDNASQLISARLTQYLKSIATPVPSTGVTPTISPTTTPKPTLTPIPTATPDVSKSYVKVYLTFLGISSKTGAILDRLDSHNYKACFFATAEQIKENAGLVRRIYGSGHSLGILLGDRPEEDSQKGIKTLFSAANASALLAASENQLNETRLEEAKSTGLILWSAEAPLTKMSLILDRLEASDKRCDLILDGADPLLKSSFEYLLDTLEVYNYSVTTINELTETRLNYVKDN
jgi:hypothetical protein